MCSLVLICVIHNFPELSYLFSLEPQVLKGKGKGKTGNWLRLYFTEDTTLLALETIRQL